MKKKSEIHETYKGRQKGRMDERKNETIMKARRKTDKATHTKEQKRRR